uniref:Dipeptidase n=1 Tax=Stomoxys calcitrans TaxID=35570 RepID=A0A1I8Q763_STOCA
MSFPTHPEAGKKAVKPLFLRTLDTWGVGDFSLDASLTAVVESDVFSSSDTETIPPVPPPPAMKRNGSIRSLRLLQHLQQQQQQNQHQTPNPRSTIHCNGKPQTMVQGNGIHHNNNTANGGNNHNNNNNAGGSHSNASIATLCSGDLLNDCAKSVHDVRTVIDDCTTSILKCANAVSSDIMSTTSTTTNGSYKPQLATLTTAHGKPDVCHVTKTSTSASAAAAAVNSSLYGKYPPPYAVHDDITVPRSQKSDPSLCFLHKGSSGAINVGPPPAMAGYNGTDLHLSQRDLQQKLQQYKNSSRLSLSKYNTIGPSSDYARQLAMYSSQQQPYNYHHQQQQQQQQTHFSTMRPLGAGERCRCFSKSWSNFSSDFLQSSLCANHDNHTMPHQLQQIFHNAKAPASAKGRNEVTQQPSLLRSNPSYTSRSFNNLIDIVDNYNYDPMGMTTKSSSLHHHQLHATNSQVCNGNATLISNSSGLKDNKLLHGHQHLHQHYPTTNQHKDFHCDDHHVVADGHQHHHHHTLVGSGSGHQLKSSSEKFNSSNHHPPHHSSLTSIMPWKHRQSPSRGSSSSGTNSFRFDAAKHWLAVSSILLIIGAASVAVPLALRVAASAPFEERLRVALQLLDQVPLIDGHNDLPWNIRKFLHNKLNDFNFNEDLREVDPWKRSNWSHTDLTRLKKGKISAQFWAAYVPCEAQHRDAVQLTLEQIDVIKRLTDRYSPQLTTCTSAQDIIEAHKNHQLCSLTGVEGGHSLGGSLAVLRTLYAMGVRYMTLTSTCHTPWADSSNADAPTFNVKHGGLTIFGKYGSIAFVALDIDKGIETVLTTAHPLKYQQNIANID